MLRQPLLKRLLPLTLATALLAPLAASAQAPPPVPPIAPAPPAAPMAPKNASRVNGKITAIDAATKTVTVSRGKKGKKTTTLSVPDGTKIYKAGERRNPSGTFADLTVDTMITARTNGDADKPVATQVHLQAPKNTAAADPAAPAAPAPSMPPVPPAAP